MSKDLLNALKENIKKELDLCEPGETPMLCANISTPAGFLNISSMVLDRVLKEKISISAAITQLESEISPNSYIN